MRRRPHAPAAHRDGSNPVASAVVALSYRRGLEQAVISARPIGLDRSAWSDPFFGEGQDGATRTVTLEGGLLDRAQARVVLDPLSIPNVWAMGDDPVITVAGDLTPEELVAAAQSIR